MKYNVKAMEFEHFMVKYLPTLKQPGLSHILAADLLKNKNNKMGNVIAT